MFKTTEQKVVVECRIKSGYECFELDNGDWMCVKGKHTMVINSLGYDKHVAGITYKIKEV